MYVSVVDRSYTLGTDLSLGLPQLMIIKVSEKNLNAEFYRVKQI